MTTAPKMETKRKRIIAAVLIIVASFLFNLFPVQVFAADDSVLAEQEIKINGSIYVMTWYNSNKIEVKEYINGSLTSIARGVQGENTIKYFPCANSKAVESDYKIYSADQIISGEKITTNKTYKNARWKSQGKYIYNKYYSIKQHKKVTRQLTCQIKYTKNKIMTFKINADSLKTKVGVTLTAVGAVLGLVLIVIKAPTAAQVALDLSIAAVSTAVTVAKATGKVTVYVDTKDYNFRFLRSSKDKKLPAKVMSESAKITAKYRASKKKVTKTKMLTSGTIPRNWKTSGRTAFFWFYGGVDTYKYPGVKKVVAY